MNLIINNKDMKNLFDFILESTNKKNIKLENAYLLASIHDRDKCPNNLKSSSRGHEYMRGYFGDNPNDAENSITTMLSKMGININDINLQYGRFKDASGDYDALKITSNTEIHIKDYGFDLVPGEYLYIVNTHVEKSVVRKKSLTPDALNLTADSYNTIDDLKRAVEEGIKSGSLNKYSDTLMNICNLISGHKAETLSDLLDKEITYTADKFDIGELTDVDFRNIANDFGEVLGPIMLMDTLTNSSVSVSFPTDSNSALYDYFININKDPVIFFSAKAGDGATPSSVIPMKQIKKLCDEGEIDINGDNNKNINKDKAKIFLNNIVPILADDSKTKESKSAIRRSVWQLASIIKDNDDIMKKVFDIFENNDVKIDINNGVSLKDMDKLFKDNTLSDLLKELYDVLEFTPRDYPIDTIIKDYKQLNKKTKEGIIFYPVKAHICDYLNSEFDEAANYYLSIVMSGYQMYFNHKIKDDTIKISFTPKQMSEYSFVFKPEGSVSNPLLKAIGIKMTKKKNNFKFN